MQLNPVRVTQNIFNYKNLFPKLMDSGSIWNTSNIIALVSVVLAAIAIGVSLWIFFKQRSIKQLAYRVIANENLLSFHKDLEKDLVILFQNQKINKLWLLMLEFKNTGNVPILKNDFESPLLLKLPPASNILGIDVIDVYPKNLNIELFIDTGGFSISPCLINPRDKFSIKLLMDSSVNSNIINVEGRITGISEIKQLKSFIETEMYRDLILNIISETLPRPLRRLFDFFFPIKKENQTK